MDEQTTTTTETSGQTGQTAETTQSQGQEAQQQEKLYTKAELDSMAASIRRKAEADAKKAAEDAAKKAAMDETERAKVEKQEALDRANQAEARMLAAERKAELAGHVSKPDQVLKLIGADTDKYFGDDGKANL